MDDKQRFRAYVTRTEGDGRFEFTAATAGVKRDGLDLNMAGGRVDNYLANPVVLWAHDYLGQRLPIGRTIGLRMLKRKMKARVQFDMDDPFAAEVARKVDAGYLNTMSVGWTILKMADDNRTVDEWDLLDISVVPVPGDPQALVERQAAAVRSWAEHVLHPEPGEDLLDDVDLVRAMEDDDDDDAEWLVPPGHVKLRDPEDVWDGTPVDTTLGQIMDRGAIAPHNTPKADEAAGWDGPGEVAKAESARGPLRRMHAWVDGDADPDTKRAYKLPHHRASGEVVWRGVAAAMARLMQQGTQIPDQDFGGVYRHLAGHYRQFDKEPPARSLVTDLQAAASQVWRLLPPGSRGDDMLAAAVALKEAAQQFIDAHAATDTPPNEPDPGIPDVLLSLSGLLGQAGGEKDDQETDNDG